MGTVSGDLVHVVGGGHGGRFDRGPAVVDLAAKTVAATQTRPGAGAGRCPAGGDVGERGYFPGKNSFGPGKSTEVPGHSAAVVGGLPISSARRYRVRVRRLGHRFVEHIAGAWPLRNT